MYNLGRRTGKNRGRVYPCVYAVMDVSYRCYLCHKYSVLGCFSQWLCRASKLFMYVLAAVDVRRYRVYQLR